MEKLISIPHRGFSTLMALGTIGILLIVVTGVASLYLSELKLSRSLYEDVITSLSAEGAFEYAMLKVRNHSEGFEDSLGITDTDSSIFSLSSERSRGLKTTYTIENASSNKIFSVRQNEHLIIPLFSSNESLIPGSLTSKNPSKNMVSLKVKNLGVTGIHGLNWSIIAMNGNENIGLSGTGNIALETIGNLRRRASDCYDSNGDKLGNCDGTYEEILDYFYDTPKKVSDFLEDPTTENPYLMIYNEGLEKEITITTDEATPFTLPMMTVEARSEKNGNSRVYEWKEDKNKYYETLKYGVYNNE